jgi:hypothetical protein
MRERTKVLFECLWLRRDHQSSSLTVRFVDNLRDTDDFSLVITYRHRQNDICFVTSLEVDFAVEARILVGVLDVDDVLRLGHVTSDADAERDNELLRLGMLDGVVERCDLSPAKGLEEREEGDDGAHFD